MSYGLAELGFIFLISLIPFIVGVIVIIIYRKEKNKLIGGIVVTLIGVLFFFFIWYSVDNPPLPARCDFSPEVNCLEIQVIADNENGQGILHLKLRNIIGETADFEFNAIYVYDETNTSCIVTPNSGVNIESGSVMELTCTFPQVFPKGNKAKFEIQGSYAISGSTSTTSFKGESYAEAK